MNEAFLETQEKNNLSFKTLDVSPEALRTMAHLLVDFIVAETEYVNNNLDDFTWEGADVHPVDLALKMYDYGLIGGMLGVQ